MKRPFSKQTPAKELPVRRRRLSDTPSSEPTTTGQMTFRRNSTITGSSSQHIASATELNGQLQSPRATTHHLHRKRRSFALLLLGSLLAAASLLVLIYQFMGNFEVSLYGQIKPISSDQRELYHGKIVEYFDRYPLQRLRFLLNQQQLADFLQENTLSEVKAIASVVPDSLGAATVTLKMREPIASWLIQGSRQYVDTDGIVFGRNYFDAPTVEIRDESNFAQQEGQQAQAATSRRFLQFIGKVVQYYSEYKRPVKQVTIPATATRQVIITVEGGYNVKMTVDRPAGEQAEDGLRAIEYVQRKHTKTEYIDVRVSGRAFYR